MKRGGYILNFRDNQTGQHDLDLHAYQSIFAIFIMESSMFESLGKIMSHSK